MTRLVVVALALALGGPAWAAPPDPLAAEISRWTAFLKARPDGDELWAQVKADGQGQLDRASSALRAGRRQLALLRLAAAHETVAAAAYMAEHPAARKEAAAFEAEWVRMGSELAADLGPAPASAFDGIPGALPRALAEAARPQVRIYHDASLEYGRNTQPEAGLYYLGAARAQRELPGALRSWVTASDRRSPAPRSLAVELDALQSELLAAYRPPASIDRHRDFIGASGALKEARELDAAGLHHGALLRYLQAAQRFAPLRPAPALDGSALQERLRGFRARLGDDLDHSLGLLFVEAAEADLEEAGTDTTPLALGIAADVLPRYLAALQPGGPLPARPQPRATVTLIRWPST